MPRKVSIRRLKAVLLSLSRELEQARTHEQDILIPDHDVRWAIEYLQALLKQEEHAQ
jgi:hypothetical protein